MFRVTGVLWKPLPACTWRERPREEQKQNRLSHPSQFSFAGTCVSLACRSEPEQPKVDAGRTSSSKPPSAPQERSRQGRPRQQTWAPTLPIDCVEKARAVYTSGKWTPLTCCCCLVCVDTNLKGSGFMEFFRDQTSEENPALYELLSLNTDVILRMSRHQISGGSSKRTTWKMKRTSETRQLQRRFVSRSFNV